MPISPSRAAEIQATSPSTPIAEKVAYVKRQGQTRDHHCHWPGCDKQVPPAMWGCKEHWYKLPKRLRDKIWATYRPGQERNMTPSAHYVEAAREVQNWIRENYTSKEVTDGLYLLRDALKIGAILKAIAESLRSEQPKWMSIDCPNCTAHSSLTVFIGSEHEPSHGQCNSCTLSWQG